MASAYDLVLLNFIYRMESIAVNETMCRRRMRYNPRPDEVDPDTSAGMVRSFTVDYISSEPANEVEDAAERITDSTWEVAIAYPIDSARGEDELQRLMMKDRHDVIKTLRDTRLYDGTSAAAPTAETNLHRRQYLGDEIERGAQTWHLTTTWGCTVFESEA